MSKPVSLADALFTKTQQQVLGVLFSHADRSFYSNEVVRLADIGIGTVQRELAKLAAAGVLTVTRQGNQKHYQANSECPVFAELRGIVSKTFGLADVLSAALAPSADRILLAFVYGSQAKGGATVSSDVDVMLIVEGLSYAQLMEALAGAEQALGRTVNPTLYSPAEFNRKLDEGSAFLARVMEQPKIILKGSVDDVRKSVSNKST